MLEWSGSVCTKSPQLSNVVLYGTSDEIETRLSDVWPCTGRMPSTRRPSSVGSRGDTSTRAAFARGVEGSPSFKAALFIGRPTRGERMPRSRNSSVYIGGPRGAKDIGPAASEPAPVKIRLKTPPTLQQLAHLPSSHPF